jgi:hypothetical protein
MTRQVDFHEVLNVKTFKELKKFHLKSKKYLISEGVLSDSTLISLWDQIFLFGKGKTNSDQTLLVHSQPRIMSMYQNTLDTILSQTKNFKLSVLKNDTRMRKE